MGWSWEKLHTYMIKFFVPSNFRLGPGLIMEGLKKFNRLEGYFGPKSHKEGIAISGQKDILYCFLSDELLAESVADQDIVLNYLSVSLKVCVLKISITDLVIYNDPAELPLLVSQPRKSYAKSIKPLTGLSGLVDLVSLRILAGWMQVRR